MDMKKILQAFDGASTKPVEGASDMSKFLSIIDKNDVSVIREEVNNNKVLNEGANPHKVTLPVQMAMQHYQEPVVKQPRTIREVKKTAMSSLLYQYYNEVQQESETEESSRKEIISEQARQLAARIIAKENRLDELSKETLQSYKSKAEDQVKELEPHAKDGEYKDLAKNAIKKRKAGIKTAEKKIAAKSVDESFYRRPDAYERDYQSSISGMGRSHRREVDDEANIMYFVVDGRLKQKMVDVRDERSAKAQDFRYEQKDALKAAGIIRSKFDPNKFVQKVGTQWVQVYPFGKPEEK